MLKSIEDRALAFFEDLVSNNKVIDVLKEAFSKVMEESTYFSSVDEQGESIIYSFYFDKLNKPIFQEESFDLFLIRKLKLEKKKSENHIESRASKVLSQPSFDNTFFNYIENTLIELNKKSNIMDYLVINKTVIEIMNFYHSRYNKNHNFSKEYLDTLSVYRKISNKEKTTLSFNWKEKGKHKELKYLYNSLIKAEPPFISSSFETFYKAFTNQKLEDNETVKWLCKSVKNKKVISQFTLVVLLNALFSSGFIVSDLNDFNKTIENLFSKPNGVKLKNIKETKKVKSNNPSRAQEIKAILDGLSKIA